MKQLRHHRPVLGVFASCLLLLNLLIAAASGPQASPAAADPLGAALARQICASGGDPASRRAPPVPDHHAPQCPLCGTSCPMGSCAPVGPGAARIALIEPTRPFVSAIVRPAAALRSGFARYPSDVVSQAPPATA
ncbi:MAG: hypothetical protein U1E53_18220 [Dongiaceae bacterium]